MNKKIIIPLAILAVILPAIGVIVTEQTDSSIDMVITEDITGDDDVKKLLRRVNSSLRLQDIPIVVAGKSFGSSFINELLGLGVQDIILLPVAKETLQAKVEKAVMEGKRTVLVVDDEPAIVDIIREHLELERFTVLTAYDAEQGLEVLKKNQVHAVVSDVYLPGMSGIELLMAVKKDYPGIPFLVITGFAGKFSPRDALTMGADGYFAKPFKNVEMVYTLRRVLQRYSARSNTTRSTTPSRTEPA